MAGTTADKLAALVSSTEAIRTAIEFKGVACDTAVPLSRYEEKIRAISGGGFGMEIPGSVETVTPCSYDQPPLTIVQQPEDFTGPLGAYAPFTVSVIAKAPSYQWQYTKDSQTWINSGIDGNTSSATLVEITESRAANYYRCVITDGDGNTCISAAIRMHLEQGE